MIIRGKEKWKEVIEAHKQKALILEEENTFLPVILDKSNDVIDFDIDHHHISCSKQNLKILLENLL